MKSLEIVKDNRVWFSGLSIGRITTLPDFSKWPNLRRLNFSNCKISETSGFMTSSGRKALRKITYIDLSKIILKA